MYGLGDAFAGKIGIVRAKNQWALIGQLQATLLLCQT